MSSSIEDRQVRHRLAVLQHVEEVTGNVAMTSRYYRITRQTFYVWKRRYELGDEGLKDRSHRPKVSTNATHTDVVGKILYLRQNYHFGPGKIAMYLKRYRPDRIVGDRGSRHVCWSGLDAPPGSTCCTFPIRCSALTT